MNIRCLPLEKFYRGENGRDKGIKGYNTEQQSESILYQQLMTNPVKESQNCSMKAMKQSGKSRTTTLVE